MDIKTATERLEKIYGAAMGQDPPNLDAAMETLKLMPKDIPTAPPAGTVRIVDCDTKGNLTIDFNGLKLGKKPRKIKAVNYTVGG